MGLLEPISFIGETRGQRKDYDFESQVQTPLPIYSIVSSTRNK